MNTNVSTPASENKRKEFDENFGFQLQAKFAKLEKAYYELAKEVRANKEDADGMHENLIMQVHKSQKLAQDTFHASNKTDDNTKVASLEDKSAKNGHHGAQLGHDGTEGELFGE